MAVDDNRNHIDGFASQIDFKLANEMKIYEVPQAHKVVECPINALTY